MKINSSRPRKAQTRARGDLAPTTLSSRKHARRLHYASPSKERILAVSTKMFADEGYSAVSVRDLASACDVTPPTIYHYFGDKETLFFRCCAAIFSSIAKKLHASLLSADQPKARIRQFTLTLSKIVLQNHDFRRLLQRNLLVDERRQFFDFFVEEFSMLVNEIAELEGLDDLADAKMHAFSIYALTFGIIQLRRTAEAAGVVKRSQLTPEFLAQRVLGTVLPHRKW